jgi:hypothetical protein
LEAITQLSKEIPEIQVRIAEFVKKQTDLEAIYLPMETTEIPNLDTDIITLLTEIKTILTVNIPALETALKQSGKDIKTYQENVEENEIIENETAKENKLKLKEYQDTFNIMNTNRYQVTQDPNETAGINIADDENDPAKIAAEIESIASSAASMALEEARAEVKRLKTEMYVMKIQEQAKVKPAKLTEKQIFHNNIVGNPVVVGAVSTMKEMDHCTLWWIVQRGNEYLARFKASATVDEVGALESYKTWTQKEKAKRLAGFTHSTKSESQPSSAQKATPAKDSPFFDAD